MSDLAGEAMLRPEKLLELLGIQGLCSRADCYHDHLDNADLMEKPFSYPGDAPRNLYMLGVLLSGLRLGKGMIVLDYGAGSCWLSRFLNQMRCSTISLDVSAKALNIGKRLFQMSSPLKPPVAEPRFLLFDGTKIDLPSASVDRVVCFDSFHHVPNPREVLAEFARVLKPGGLAGFGEPGRCHSQSPRSQKEMRDYQVLENDIVPEALAEMAAAVGLTEFRCRLLTDPDFEVSLDTYKCIVPGGCREPSASEVVLKNVSDAMNCMSIFFLGKGPFVSDSRVASGLQHSLKSDVSTVRAKKGVPFKIPVSIKNTGSSRWLCSNIADIGVVKLGAHLCEASGMSLDYDFVRHHLSTGLAPGQEHAEALIITLNRSGTFILTIDMVSEHVTWFEEYGSAPLQINVIVD